MTYRTVVAVADGDTGTDYYHAHDKDDHGTHVRRDFVKLCYAWLGCDTKKLNNRMRAGRRNDCW